MDITFLGLVVGFWSTLPAHGVIGVSSGTCEPLQESMCRDLSYTHTIFPNMLGHEFQSDAILTLQTFVPLVETDCSPDLLPFLCSVYLPECESGKAKTPCRWLCLAARQGCESLLRRFGFSWPQSLNCDVFTKLSCEGGGDTETNITQSDLPLFLNRGEKSDQQKVLSPDTCRILFKYSDTDASQSLDEEEYLALKGNLSVMRQQFSETWIPEPQFSTFTKILADRGISLSRETAESLQKVHGIGRKTTYDHFVAILVRLEIMKRRFEAKVLTGLPCGCKIAGFNFDEFVLHSAV